MNTFDAIYGRRAVKHYDSEHELTDDELRKLMEAAIQCAEEEIPVLLVTQEMAAPVALKNACPSEQPFSSAVLLAPPTYCEDRIASIQFSIHSKPVTWPMLPDELEARLDNNFGARLLPLLAKLVSIGKTQEHGTVEFPLNAHSSIKLSVLHPGDPNPNDD